MYLFGYSQMSFPPMDAVSKMRVCLVCVWEVLTSGRLTFIKGHQRKLKGLTLATDLTSILQDTSDFFCCACSVSKPTWITWVQGIKTSEWICYTAHKRFNHARTLTSWVWVFPDMFISETCDDAFSDSAQHIAHVLHMCFTNWTSQYLFFWGT